MNIDFKEIDSVLSCVLLSNEMVGDNNKTFRFNSIIYSLTDCC